MRRDDLDAAPRLSDPVKLRNKSHYVGNVFNYVAADHLIEFVVGERIRHDSQIVDHIGMTARV